MSQIVLVIENDCLFSLVVEPVNILGICQDIIFTAKKSKWEIKKTEIIIRWSFRIVFLHVNLRAIVISIEGWLIVIEELAIVPEVSQACSRWFIRGIDIPSILVISGWIFVHDVNQEVITELMVE